YLATLQDLGDELITLARQVDALDAESLTLRQGELNTAAYYLTRGSLAKNIRSADEISAHLGRLLDELRPALPTLGSAEQVAFEELGQAYRAARERARVAGDVAWSDRQLGMMAYNPFANSWEQVWAFQAATGSVDTPAAEDSAAAATETDWMRRLAAQWERVEVLSTPGISPAERELALQLLSEDYPLAAEPGDMLDAEQRLASGLAGAAGTAVPLHALARAVSALGDVPDAGRPDQLPAMLTATVAAVGQVERGTTELSLRLRFADVADDRRLADDILLMRLRGALSRYRLQSGSYMQRLAAIDTADLDAARLGELVAEVQGLAVARRALAAMLTRLSDEHKSGLLAGDQARRSYEMYPLLARSRSLARYIAAIGDGTEPADVARRLLESSPEARLDYLADEAAAGDKAAELLTTCEALLTAEPVRVDDYETGRVQARELVVRLRSAALGQPDIQAAADEVVNRLERLAVPARPEPVLVRQRLFSLGEAQQQLERLNRRIGTLVTQRDDTTSGFSGGPPGIWERELRTDAEHARQRLLKQIRFAQQRATMSILAGLQPQPDRAETASGVAWSRFYHRVMRSELAGPLRQRARRRDDDQQGDRFLKWLAAELETARKAARADDTRQNVYRPITVEYLDSMADFLRY
ncbi:hypothetical protein HQ590_14870, partial [bacterium]|nr:hypothetical protein [bacterium]